MDGVINGAGRMSLRGGNPRATTRAQQPERNKPVRNRPVRNNPHATTRAQQARVTTRAQQ
eukprot:154269-Chlamydomonas_euryale.AAC.2